MESTTNNALKSAILRLLVRILLRNGLSYGVFTELVRWVYVDVAREEFGIEGRKQTDSRVSILTGFTRKEVKRLRQVEPINDTATTKQYNQAARAQDSHTWLQRKVAYDNIPVEALDKLRIISKKEGQKLLEKLDRLISQNDRDVSPEVSGTGQKQVTIGIFYFEGDADTGAIEDE